RLKAISSTLHCSRPRPGRIRPSRFSSPTSPRPSTRLPSPGARVSRYSSRSHPCLTIASSLSTPWPARSSGPPTLPLRLRPPPTAITVGANPSGVVISGNGKFAYVANSGGNDVSAIALSDLSVTSISVGSGSAVPFALAVANTSAGDTLAVLDTAAATVYFIGMRPDPSSPTALGDPVTG